MDIVTRDHDTILDREPLPSGTRLAVSISTFRLLGRVINDHLLSVGHSRRLPFEQSPRL
jgi:hypothetical protein